MYKTIADKTDNNETLCNARKYKKKLKILTLIVYILATLLYVNGLYQKLYFSAEMRIKYLAIPIAISTLYQEHKHDYTGWRSTGISFQGPEDLTDAFLAERIRAPVDQAQGNYYWIGDDRGFADYVIASFLLFGPHMLSLYHFWFVILFVSLILFTLSFGRQLWAMSFLALAILSMHSAVVALKFSSYGSGSVSLFEPRFFDTLALISVCHMLFFSFTKKKFSIKDLLCLVGQICIFVFLFSARSSLLWEVIAVCGVCAYIMIVRKKKRRYPPLLVIGLLLCALFLLNSYKCFTYHENYLNSGLSSRIFWHNMLMGLNIKAKPELKVDDHSIAQAVFQHAQGSKNCAPYREKLTSVVDLFNSLGNHGIADWAAYERCAKDLYFSTLLQNKWEAIQLYLCSKPLQAISSLPSFKWEFSVSSPYNLWHLFSFCAILAFSMQSIYFHRKRLIMIVLALFFGSLTLPVIFYSGNINCGGLSAMLPMLIYLGTTICISVIYILMRTQLKFKTFSNSR